MRGHCFYMFYKFMKFFFCFDDIGNMEFRIYDSIDVENIMLGPKKHYFEMK
jgi:hypothetical protein